jgi:hypothetical protein
MRAWLKALRRPKLGAVTRTHRPSTLLLVQWIQSRCAS